MYLLRSNSYCLLLHHAGGRGTRTFIKTIFSKLEFKNLKGCFHGNQRNPPRSATADYPFNYRCIIMCALKPGCIIKYVYVEYM